ncbi:hypothetical protein [Streptomyces sp. NPDC048489]|uniref:hypothetical protein n=1 Tax=Streptomyces sp. NPDC048489 TaxID=3154504 RepID=UPI00344349EB
MLTHSLERGVLVLKLDDNPSAGDRDSLARYICDLINAHSPAPVVIIIGRAASQLVVAAVIEAHRMSSKLKVLVGVATSNASIRRALEAANDFFRPRIVVHARTDVAMDAALAAIE